uniref:C2H2-type domain-containing protein n=1 Tax=Anguilla anguilla TaxID=7936 RepID=A0A0E9VH72_ANGAN
MRWSCKFSTYFSGNRRRIIEHYRAVNGHYGRNCPLPCIYSDCPLVFRSQQSLKNHLREHGVLRHGPIGLLNFKINCQLL